MRRAKHILLFSAFVLLAKTSFCWGFYAHQKINYYAVFLLPPQMLLFYKPNIQFLSEHAVAPDKRRYAVADEAPRHYIDLDAYHQFPIDSLPRRWDSAVAKLSLDTLHKHGIVPWWVQTMQYRLTEAFKEKDGAKILKLSAEIGHYISDAHVPLHASSNYNGQHTDQHGIHGFWESRLPELLAERDWNFFIGKAEYISNTSNFIWQQVLESAAAADTGLKVEKELSKNFPADKKFAFETRNGIVVRQYSTAYAKAYDAALKGMVERRMQQSIFAIASFWLTAWINAGQPDLTTVTKTTFTERDLKEFEDLNKAWRDNKALGRVHE